MAGDRVGFPVTIVLAAALACHPAVAGYSGKKCTLPTQECLNLMATNLKSSGWIGVELDRDEVTGALTINTVIPGSPAASAGLLPGDELYTLNGVKIAGATEEAIHRARGEWKPGQRVIYTIKRDGVEKTVVLTLASWPADAIARTIGEHMLEHAKVDPPKN